MNKIRDTKLDIIKGIAITLMVIGHTDFPFKRFIYLFHIAVFFIVSGYLYNSSCSYTVQSLTKYIKRKICTLWFPFFLWNTIFSILHNFFININVYTNNELFLLYCEGDYCRLTQYWSRNEILNNILRGAFFAGDTQLGGAFWFLKVLFVLSIMYAIVEYILIKICNNYVLILQTLISILLLSAGYYFGVNNVNIFSIQIVFSCYCLYHFGVLLQNAKKYEYSSHLHFMFLLVSFGLLSVLNNFGEISLGNNNYPNPVFMLFCSFLGWIFVSEVAFFFEKYEVSKKIFICLGRSTLSILVLHFLCFKIVSYIGVICENKPYYLVASFPILYRKKLWWCAYTVAGLAVPVFLHKVWTCCRDKSYIFKEKYD